MQYEDRIRLYHMIDACKDVIDFSADCKQSDLDSDRKLLLAIVKSIEIVGEAASKLTDEAKGNAPEIPWRAIIAMRNRLIHSYFDIDTDIVWKTVNEEIPGLLQSLEEIVSKN